MEHILTNQLTRYAEEDNIFHPNQHGFRRDHGCKKQLIEFVCDIAIAIAMSHDSAMKQITGYQARGPGFDPHSRHTRVIPGS